MRAWLIRDAVVSSNVLSCSETSRADPPINANSIARCWALQPSPIRRTTQVGVVECFAGGPVL